MAKVGDKYIIEIDNVTEMGRCQLGKRSIAFWGYKLATNNYKCVKRGIKDLGGTT